MSKIKLPNGFKLNDNIGVHLQIAGIERQTVDEFEECKNGLPDWWHDKGNQLFLARNTRPPSVAYDTTFGPPSGAQIIINKSDVVPHLIVWGLRPFVSIGTNVRFPDSVIACGGLSTVIVDDNTVSTCRSMINCRNGGLVYVGKNGLWASDVSVWTDDMHAILDNTTKKRLNCFGGRIILEHKIWLCEEARIIGDVRIGTNSIIGTRSIVTRDIAAYSLAAGSPAKIIRDNVTWSADDLPP